MADGGRVIDPKVAIHGVIAAAMDELASFNELRKRVAYVIKSCGGTSYAVDRDNGEIVVHGELNGAPFELLVHETHKYQHKVKVSTW